MRKWNGRFVVLTGASSGLGRELAEQLIRIHGCRVLGIARREDRLRRLAEKLGENFTYRAFDVSDRAAWQRLAEELTSIDQPIDLLFHCAGMLPAFDRADRTGAELVEQVCRVDFLSAVYGTEALLPLLKRAAFPIIAVIASAGGIAPLAGTSAYAAAKAACIAYFSALREEWRGSGQVTVLCPGFIKTDIFRHQSGVSGSEWLLNSIAADVDTTARRMIRLIRRGRGYAVMGVDGHLLSMGMRLCPTLTLRLCRRVMRTSGLPLFSAIFEKN